VEGRGWVGIDANPSVSVGCQCVWYGPHCAMHASCPPLADIKANARALSQLLIDSRNVTKYGVHGLFGIFGSGDRIADNPARRYFVNYEDTKVDFMYTHACRFAKHVTRPTVCEIGFNAGLSALLLLESIPNARVLSFDLGDLPWSRAADKILRKSYGAARFPGVTFGDSKRTIPQVATKRPFRCDLSFVDGDKTYQGRYNTLVALRDVASNQSVVFMDEVTSEACVNGTYASDSAQHKRSCAALNHGYWPSVRAYNRACREGWLRVQRCVWPRRHPHDGLCIGHISYLVRTYGLTIPLQG